MDIGRTYASRILDYHAPLGVKEMYPLGNLSCCPLANGHYLISVRQFNYTLEPVTAKRHLFSDFFAHRAYFMAEVDQYFTFVKPIVCEGIEMMEDLRLVRHGNVIQASGTDVSFGRKTYKMVCLEFDLNDDEGRMALRRKTVFPVPHEKNYLPVEDGPGVFVTDLLTNSLRMTSVADPARKVTQGCRGLTSYSGSSPLLRYRDGYVALVHRHMHKRYFNAFAFFDKRMVQCRLSDEFTVFSHISGVNFSCGMVIRDEKAILPVCIHDRTTYLFELPLQHFATTARWRA